MDILAVGSLIATFGLVIGAIIITGSPGAFISLPSMLITIGGSFGAVALSASSEELKNIPYSLKKAFMKQKIQNLPEARDVMVDLSRKARSEGLLALEEMVKDVKDDFIRKSTQLVIDGTSPEVVQSILDTEIDLLERRELSSRRVFDLLGELAPAFGMLGTLIGLIQMLRNLDTPEALGPGMALALLTTLYGSMIANAFAIPVSKKIAVQTSSRVSFMEIVVEGVLSIQAGENPRLVEEKLGVFLPPEERVRSKGKKGAKDKKEKIPRGTRTGEGQPSKA
ncbi:MAG TPA: motility protein A [Synergistetes bacterium]|nr:motility protein A [Synergistota bacterium]